jgi:hypothetical protein
MRTINHFTSNGAAARKFQNKVVTSRWPVPRDSAVELGFPTSQ